MRFEEVSLSALRDVPSAYPDKFRAYTNALDQASRYGMQANRLREDNDTEGYIAARKAYLSFLDQFEDPSIICAITNAYWTPRLP